MNVEEQLDLSHLRASTVPFQALLFISGAIGVALGIGMIIVGLFFATMLTPVGLVAAMGAAITFGMQATNLVLLGALAVVLVPLGAMVAAHLKLGAMREFVLHKTPPTYLKPDTELARVFTQLARRAGLNTPPKYGLLEHEVNALAYGGGRDSGLVLVGVPLLRTLRAPEILAIIGHEMGHIALLDHKRIELALGHQEFLVRFLVFAGLKRFGRAVFGFIAELALAFHSRHREYWADAVGAYLVGSEHMISALTKVRNIKTEPSQIAGRYQELLFRPEIKRLFATHPTFESRIAALEARTYLDRLPRRQVELPTEPEQAAASYPGM